jgi:hypothetical protein
VSGLLEKLKVIERAARSVERTVTDLRESFDQLVKKVSTENL